MNRPASRIGRRLALLALGIGLVLVPLLSGNFLLQNYHYRVARIDSQLDDILRANARSLQESLWLGDEALVNSQLAGIKNFRDMAMVRLDQPGKPSRIIGTAPPANATMLQRTQDIRHGFAGKDVLLGTLSLTVSLERLRAEILHDAWWIVLSETLQILIVAGLILLAYQRLAGRRLHGMVSFLENYRLADRRGRMSCPAAASQDELDVLAVSFNTLLDEQERNIAQLQESNASLAHEVAVRTETERVLSVARDAAETANRAKSVFLANMSHELRTPLNAILGFAQLMEHDARLPQDARANLTTINKSGQHLLALINDVLEISRIESGRLTLQSGALDLHELLATLVEVMTQRAANKGLSLRLERADSVPRYIQCDSGKLRQILLNLLSNAVKYSEQGEVVLTATASCHEQRAELVFEVSDSGVGIGAADLERIFQPFFQTEYGIQLGEGTGLGLTICREYARLLGGELTAQSTPGVGSVFTLRLGAALGEAPEPATLAPSGRVRRLAAGQPRYRILVAEDNPDNQRLIRQILGQAGFEVRCVDNGREALADYQTWCPHFIWMDMRMPEMDGYAATRAIRALPGGREIPIVALTASAFEEDRASILDAGCNEVMKKPFETRRLFEMLARFLDVEFEYEEEQAVAAEPGPARVFTDFSRLPADLRRRLHDAAVALDADEVREITREIGPIHADIASTVTAMAERYAFDQLARLLENTTGPQN